MFNFIKIGDDKNFIAKSVENVLYLVFNMTFQTKLQNQKNFPRI